LGALVTGIGYIGARLVERLLDSGQQVVGIDNLFSTDPAVIRRLAQRQGFLFIQGNVADEVAVRRAFESGAPVDTVYHLAAQASAHPTAAPVRYTEETNLVAPRIILEQAAAAGTSALIFGSSLQLYGRRPAGAVDEDAPFGPILDIAHLSKLYVEKLMEMFACTRGLRCVAARLGLVYGVSPVMKTDPRFMTAPNKFCRQAALGEPLRVDVSALYPTAMIHVDDAARGLMALSRWPHSGFTAVNLIGETVSVARVAEMVAELGARRGLQVQIVLPDPRPEVPHCSFHSAASAVGFTPRFSLQEGLGPVLEHFMRTSPHPDPLPRGEGEIPSSSWRGKGARGLGPEFRP